MFICHRIFFILLLILVSLVPVTQAEESSLAKAMAEHMSCYPVELIHLKWQEPSITRQDLCLAKIYHERGAEPLWVTEDGPGYRASIIYKYLKYAANEGLDPKNYQVEKLDEIWRDRSFGSLAILDSLLTYNLVKYVHDVSYGQYKPFMADPKLFAEAGERAFDPVDTIEKLLVTEDLDLYLKSLPPDNIHYKGLRKGLAEYRQISTSGEWQKIAVGKNISPGEKDARIVSIRSRLALLSGKERPTEENSLYDKGLKKEILLFQTRYGLKPDGIIGRKTLKELNISPFERIDQIKINMARWRWQDHDLGDEYILVNIANYTLYGYRNDNLELSLPVIVGKFQHQTPVFSDNLKYLEFNPFWNIPPSIAKNEELPELQINPYYLVEKNIRLFSNWQSDGIELDSTIIDWNQITRSQMAHFKLRQDPGPSNALGKVKFVFPNQYSVYLHDTPTKKLFSEQDRSFSHGCIRVSQPEKLALFALSREEGNWNELEVLKLFNEEERKVIRIRRPLPIHLTYQTAWLDKGGRIHFNNDIYARDKKLYKALFTR